MMSRLAFLTSPWASGLIRGQQVAERLGDCAVYEPEGVYSDDVVVCVKCMPPESVVGHCKRIWVDVIDCYGIVTWLRRHPGVGVIAISGLAEKWLRKQLPEHEIRLIPEHHCNFEGNKLTIESPRVVGFIGYPGNLHIEPAEVIKALAPLEMSFVWCMEFGSRREVCTFYRAIDIQLTFRKDGGIRCPVPELKNPLKLNNAGSFGIPTVGYPEQTYVDEWDGCFMPVHSLDEVVYWCDRLKREPELYQRYAALALERAKDYHIDKIVPLYKELLDGR